MKKSSIRILGILFKEIQTNVLLDSPDESVAFLTARHFDTGEKGVFLPQEMVPANPSDYLRQGPYHLQVSPMYVNRVLNVAEMQGNTIVMVHSHPFEKGVPYYSPTDDHGEALTSETISKCLEANPPVGSILFGRNQVSARIWTGLSKKEFPSDLNVLKENAFLLHRSSRKNSSNKKGRTLNRQTEALGESFQKTLEQLEIGVVGLGGTGSAVAEQLTRMGAKKMRLVDHDKLEHSNLSRVYGSSLSDVRSRKYKVDALESHLSAINPQLEIVKVRETVMKKDVLVSLANCDIIFSCLDRHAPRAVLNELSYQCFIPIIDVGVGLEHAEDGMVGGSARATLIGPGLPCLICQEIVRPDVITAENLSPREYESRRAEGYVAELQQNAPSVIAYTSLASTLGIMFFIDLISNHFADTYTSLIFDIASKQTVRMHGRIREECVCKKRLGKGLGVPFSVAD
jgi:hypothetical protein